MPAFTRMRHTVGRAQDDPVALGQELGQVRVVRSCVAGVGQGHHFGPGLLLYGVTRSAPSVPMSKRGYTPLPIRRNHSPNMAFAHSQDFGYFFHTQIMGRHAVEHLRPRLYSLGQCQSFHE